MRYRKVIQNENLYTKRKHKTRIQYILTAKYGNIYYFCSKQTLYTIWNQ